MSHRCGFSLGQALRLSDAHAYRDSRVNRDAAQTDSPPVRLEGPLCPDGGSDDGAELQGDSQADLGGDDLHHDAEGTVHGFIGDDR